jgi:hypothetical protein
MSARLDSGFKGNADTQVAAVVTQNTSLGDMDLNSLEKLYSASRNILAIGWLNVIGVVALAAVATMGLTKSTPSGSTIYLVATVCAPAAWISFKRPGWGHPVGVVIYSLSLLVTLLANPVQGALSIVVSILILVALARGKAPFGEGRIEHSELKRVYKERKAAGV